MESRSFQSARRGNASETVLAVDDDVDVLSLIKKRLSARGYCVLTATDVAGAIRLLRSVPVDVVVTDMRFPGENGLDLIEHVRENYRDTEVLTITGYASIPGAVQAVKAGAQEYLPKPFTIEQLQQAVERALERSFARRFRGSGSYAATMARHGLIGECTGMLRVYQMIGKAAQTRDTVLITGESGTGKELVARAIHYSSPHSAAPFVPVNCGGIPEGLLESELFGHVKGAFTGASETRAGFFQTANRGSIFLDEIANTSPAMQAKLLRVLENKEVYMVGSSRPRKIEVRILAATNKNLAGLVEKGAFREDLYYRLNVIHINVPPLRERGEDILRIAYYYLEKFSKELSKAPPRFSDRALQVLQSYEWPGNVRELENLIRRLLIMSETDTIDVSSFPSHMKFVTWKNSYTNRTLREVEAEHIRAVLASVDGNKTRAAKILGIDRKTLREKIRRSTCDR